MSDLELLAKVRKLAIVAIFSDDDLLERLVLKGGNAIDLVHGLSTRSSQDLDFSMEDEFAIAELDSIRDRLAFRLSETFRPEGYEVFDVKLYERPSVRKPGLPQFWGGYRLEFKIIEIEKLKKLEGDAQRAQRSALVIGPKQRKVLEVDISKFEFCKGKEQRLMDGYTIYVYSPAMIVAEKLRAICQQMPEYEASVPTPSRSPRARDFFDIFTVANAFQVDFAAEGFHDLLRHVFGSKAVPISLLAKIADHREYHRDNFFAVQDTIVSNVPVRDFDFYVDFVVDRCGLLKPLWEE